MTEKLTTGWYIEIIDVPTLERWTETFRTKEDWAGRVAALQERYANGGPHRISVADRIRPAIPAPTA
jgi:hypothetical protein